MKRKLLLIFFTLLLIITNAVFVYAQDTNHTSNDGESAIIVPIFDSIEEMEKAKAKKEIHTYALEDAGGTTLCTIEPVLIRTIGGVELYFDFDSVFQLSSVRFRELIIESEWIGKNFFKIGSATAEYTVKEFDFSLYTGRRLIYRDINIPTDENRVIVRTKGLHVYRNNPAGWLSCQYQITDKWEIR